MARAAAGEFGTEPAAEYGLCPRGLLDICRQLDVLRKQDSSTRFVLTASAVELTAMEGAIDMFDKAQKVLVRDDPQRPPFCVFYPNTLCL